MWISRLPISLEESRQCTCTQMSAWPTARKSLTTPWQQSKKHSKPCEVRP
eukprot:SAG31_NODE_6833_length_1875_cov_1.606982_1_plen_49_part_10